MSTHVEGKQAIAAGEYGVEKHTTAQMVGELLREGGLLILVFGMLDGLLERVKEGESVVIHHAPPTEWYIGTAVFSFAAIALGVIVERRR